MSDFEVGKGQATVVSLDAIVASFALLFCICGLSALVAQFLPLPEVLRLREQRDVE